MTSPIEEKCKELTREQIIDFACWLANTNEQHGQQELVDWYEDVLNGISTYNLMFRHTPVKSFSAMSNQLLYVACRGKTLEEAVANYKREFDKTRWKMVEYRGVVK